VADDLRRLLGAHHAEELLRARGRPSARGHRSGRGGLVPRVTGPGWGQRDPSPGTWGGSHLGGALAFVAVGEELVEEDPEAPDVGCPGEDVVCQGLRRVPAGGRVLSTGSGGASSPLPPTPVPPSPEDRALAGFPHHVVVLVLRQQLGQPEIPDLDVGLALHQDVPAGQVPVDAALCPQVLHALRGMQPLAGVPPAGPRPPLAPLCPQLSPPWGSGTPFATVPRGPTLQICQA